MKKIMIERFVQAQNDKDIEDTEEYLGIDAICYNAHTPGRYTSWWRNRGHEVLARVKLFVDITRGLQPDVKESMVSDFQFYNP